MDSGRYQRIKELFQSAVELEAGQRAAFLDEACGNDLEIRAEVESLLAAEAESDELLSPHATPECPVTGLGDRLLSQHIGQYHLKSIISAGGMGTVYEAVQEKPRRTVAVKVMKEGIVSKSALRRFEYESQILARLRHPGIAQVFEAGTHALSHPGIPEKEISVPYFVMEYIPNARFITDFIHERKLGIKKRLKLFMQVCEAVHHGHQKGIIHRDLKPANILVDSSGHVKIIDFGVARATDSDLALTTLQTEVGQLIGTLQYMSPEQCQADPHDLDTRSDVYALGVVLYEILCKSLPYDVRKMSVYEAVQKIRDVQPVRPSTALHILKGDAETIVLKALEKDRERRYQSANDLMRDIDRYMKGEPIMARPPSMVYQLRIFARRNKALVGGVLAVFLVLIAGVIVSTSLYYRATHEAESAKAINAFFNDMLASVDPLHLNIVSGFLPDEGKLRKSFGGLSRDVSMEEMMRFAATKIEETFADKPELEARVRETMGTTLISLGLYAEAKVQLEEALKIRQVLPGGDSADTLRAQVQLAYIMKYTGENPKAVTLLRPAIAQMRRVFGEEHRNTLTCQCMLAASLSMQNRFDEADPLFRNTLEAQKRLLGEDHRDVLWTMTEWSYVLFVKLRGIESRKLADEAYRISLRRFGEEDYITLFSGLILACNLNSRGDYQSAETLIRSIMKNSSRILGDQHRITIYAKVVYAQLLPRDEHLQEKERILKKALADCRVSLSEGHWWTLKILHPLALVFAESGKADEVENLYRDRLKRCQEEFGEEDPHTIDDLNRLAACLVNRGKFVEGKIKYKKWVAIISKKHGDQHTLTLAARVSAAEALWYAGLREEAYAFASDAQSGWRQRVERAGADAMDYNDYAYFLLTCDPPELRDPKQALDLAMKANEMSNEEDPYVLDTLALAYHQNNDTEQAFEIQKKAVDLLPSKYKPRKRRPVEDHLIRYLLHKDDVKAAERILAERIAVGQAQNDEESLAQSGRLLEDALLLIDECRYEMAESRVRQSLAFWKKSNRAGTLLNIHNARSMLGQCLVGQCRFDEAESLLLEGYQGIKNNPLVIPKDQHLALKRIIQLYEDWGKPEEADKWKAKLP